MWNFTLMTAITSISILSADSEVKWTAPYCVCIIEYLNQKNSNDQEGDAFTYSPTIIEGWLAENSAIFHLESSNIH
jgi:hypothetical protein